MLAVSRTRWPPLGSHSSPGPRSTSRHGHAEVTTSPPRRTNKRESSQQQHSENGVSVSGNPVSKPQNNCLIRQEIYSALNDLRKTLLKSLIYIKPICACDNRLSKRNTHQISSRDLMVNSSR